MSRSPLKRFIVTSVVISSPCGFLVIGKRRFTSSPDGARSKKRFSVVGPCGLTPPRM